MGSRAGGVFTWFSQSAKSIGHSNLVVSNVEGLVHMRDPELYKEVKEAISRYEAVMGVRQKNIKLADLSDSRVVATHRTDLNGKSVGIYLNKKYFNQPKSEFVRMIQSDYKYGMLTVTNRPGAHSLTHELAHATWNNRLSSPKAKAAGKEIARLYSLWSKDTYKKNYGEYATQNINEFWAETVTKAVHGTHDRYTKAIKAIAKKYKL